MRKVRMMATTVSPIFGNVAGERGMGATVRLFPEPNGTTVQGHPVQWPVPPCDRQGGLSDV